MKKRILAVTGIRSEYDILFSVFDAINQHSSLELLIAVTGAHLSEAYGYTVEEIRKDGFTIVEQIESLINGDKKSARVKGLGIQLQGLVQTVLRVDPDWLLVLGDREEAMTTALVGAYMNIPVAHIGGGDRVVGNVDDQVRHAVTKLSHLHLTTNAASANRILKLGEQPFRVHNVGNPGLDRLLNVPTLSADDLSQRLNFHICDDEPLLMVIQHVISSEIEDAYRQMKITLEAVVELGLKTILIYPNTDAGGQQMIRAIHEYKNVPRLFTAKNLPRTEFINLLRRASCLLGNSSSGILEAPLLKLPVVNVGNRQKERIHAENVAFVPHDKGEIMKAVRRAIYDLDYRAVVKKCSNPFGDGQSAQKIAHILATTEISDELIIKDITY